MSEGVEGGEGATCAAWQDAYADVLDDPDLMPIYGLRMVGYMETDGTVSVAWMVDGESGSQATIVGDLTLIAQEINMERMEAFGWSWRGGKCDGEGDSRDD